MNPKINEQVNLLIKLDYEIQHRLISCKRIAAIRVVDNNAITYITYKSQQEGGDSGSGRVRRIRIRLCSSKILYRNWSITKVETEITMIIHPPT
jgi:hypothetical protein